MTYRCGNCLHRVCDLMQCIKKYSNYFFSRDWAGSKWCPVLKVWEQLQDKHSKVTQNSYQEVQ